MAKSLSTFAVTMPIAAMVIDIVLAFFPQKDPYLEFIKQKLKMLID